MTIYDERALERDRRGWDMAREAVCFAWPPPLWAPAHAIVTQLPSRVKEKTEEMEAFWPSSCCRLVELWVSC